MTKDPRVIIEHYENCLARHGDTHLGVDWPKFEDAQKRYQVMLDSLALAPHSPREQVVTLLDFGCGAAHLKEFIDNHQIPHLEYTGLDLSEKFVNLARQKFPKTRFYQMNILEKGDELPVFDFAVLNGTFTVKRELTHENMWKHAQNVLCSLFPHVRYGMAVNFMSKHVDWEREDLFHLSFDVLAEFIRTSLSRHFIFRQDYGLYEYTAYIYK
jgi:SAM-dependent methyltransferase